LPYTSTDFLIIELKSASWRNVIVVTIETPKDRRNQDAYDVDEQVYGLKRELLAGMTSLVKGAAAARRAIKKA